MRPLIKEDIQQLEIGDKLIFIEPDYEEDRQYFHGQVVTVAKRDYTNALSSESFLYVIFPDSPQVTGGWYFWRFAKYTSDDWWDIWGGVQ